MKELYKSPVITVEDLTKTDVLCASTETSGTDGIPSSSTNKVDNINQFARTIGDLSQFM